MFSGSFALELCTMGSFLCSTMFFTKGECLTPFLCCTLLNRYMLVCFYDLKSPSYLWKRYFMFFFLAALLLKESRINLCPRDFVAWVLRYFLFFHLTIFFLRRFPVLLVSNGYGWDYPQMQSLFLRLLSLMIYQSYWQLWFAVYNNHPLLLYSKWCDLRVCNFRVL